MMRRLFETVAQLIYIAIFTDNIRTQGSLESRVFCDSGLLSHHTTFGLHCGVWAVDSAALQEYKVSASGQNGT